MNTQCKDQQLILQGLDSRNIIVSNDAKVNSSDGGLLLLGKLEQRFGIIKKLSNCFSDSRESYRVKHSLKSLLTQRIFGIVQGYEDLNDHEELRKDPLLQYVCGAHHRVAGKSTLNRLELGMELDNEDGNRYTKIRWDPEKIENLFTQIFLDSFRIPPTQIILDFDATDLPLYGDQEGKFFHGYYDHYCYMPLYVFSGEHLLSARLRPSNIDGCAGSEQILENLVHQIRTRYPDVRIIFRGDSGFCRESILSCCDSLKIKYVVGMAGNSRLKEILAPQMEEAMEMCHKTGKASRVFTRFSYRTRKSWSRSRQVVGKAEHLSKGSNPRFVVTNIKMDDKELYEVLYCGRGDMENRIKEQKLDLFADRTSAGWMSSNQLRLWFSAFAYTFFVLLKRFIPFDNPNRRSLSYTLRLHLLKIAATVRISTRKVWVSLPMSFPYWDIWRQIATAI
jgi:hypothetical protein